MVRPLELIVVMVEPQSITQSTGLRHVSVRRMTHKAVETYLHIVIPDKVVVGVNNNVTANHENASQHAHSNTSSRG